MKIVIVAALALLSSPASAALSGFQDNAEQISTILQSAEIADALRQAPIESIEFEGTRADGAFKWEIETKGCDLDIYLLPVQPEGIGKTTYQVDLKDNCR